MNRTRALKIVIVVMLCAVLAACVSKRRPSFSGYCNSLLTKSIKPNRSVAVVHSRARKWCYSGSSTALATGILAGKRAFQACVRAGNRDCVVRGRYYKNRYGRWTREYSDRRAHWSASYPRWRREVASGGSSSTRTYRPSSAITEESPGSQ